MLDQVQDLSPQVRRRRDYALSTSMILGLLVIVADGVVAFGALFTNWSMVEGYTEDATATLLRFLGVTVISTSVLLALAALLARQMRRLEVARWWVRPCVLMVPYLLPACVAVGFVAATRVPDYIEIPVVLRIAAWLLASVLALGCVSAIGGALIPARRAAFATEPAAAVQAPPQHVQRAWLAALFTPFVAYFGAPLFGSILFGEDLSAAVWQLLLFWIAMATLPALGVWWSAQGRRLHQRNALAALVTNALLLLLATMGTVAFAL